MVARTIAIRYPEATMTNEKAREDFVRDGFVHLPGFMDADEMDAIEALWDRALREVVPTLSWNDAM